MNKTIKIQNMFSTLENKKIQPQNLQEALISIGNSIGLIYNEFSGYFHLFLLIILAYVFYILGKISVKQPVATKARNISANIQQIENQKNQIPRMIEQIKSKLKVINFLIVVSCLAGAGTIIYNDKFTTKIEYLGALIGLIIFCWIYLTLRKNLLEKRRKTIGNQQKKIKDSIRQLAQSLGPKIQNNLKNSLCRQKILSKKIAPSQECSKKSCKQYRALLKTKFEAIKHLVQSALTFEWCSICKRRPQFDELVRFEAKPMPNVPIDDEEAEAQLRINYLIQLLEGMFKWVQQAGPCNCSKLYIEQVIHNKKTYTQISKSLNDKIKMFENLEKSNSQKTSTELKNKKSIEAIESSNKKAKNQ